MSLEACKLIPVPTHRDARGALGVIETDAPIPFEPRRVYFLYDVPEAATRGQHAHLELQQFVFAVSGSFSITLDDGDQQRRFDLSSPAEGLYVAPMIWRQLSDFSPGAVCCVLASMRYQPDDYLHDYQDFLNRVRA